MHVRRLPLVVAALVFSYPALAYTIDVLPPGTLLPPAAYGPVATFDQVAPEPYGSTAPYGPLTDGGALFTGGGVVMNNFGQGSDGLYAEPYGDTTNYMAVLGGQSETIAYSGLKDSFGLYWGSVDTYNSLEFYDGATLEATVTGSQVTPYLSADGGQTSYASNGYVLITGLPSFDSVLVQSSSNSFEFDNVAARGAPEPSTWAMLGIGFVGLASLACRRGRTDRLAPAFA